jgi:hypothetical protein
MVGFQVLTLSEIDALSGELDIFTSGQAPLPGLVAEGLHTPLPICSGILIWGFEILRTARRRGMRQLSCLVIPTCPRHEMLSLALKLENRAGNFSWPEKQNMLRFLSPSGDQSCESVPTAGGSLPAAAIDPLAELSPLIEDHRDPQLAVKIGTFAALPEALKDLVAEGQIDLKTAARVQSLPAGIFHQLRSSGLTYSRRRQFLKQLFEVSRKQNLSDRDVIAETEAALKDEHPVEKIHCLRFPTLSAMEQSFAALEQDLLQGSGVQLKPPPYFEGEAFSVEFEFNSAKTFTRKLDTLHFLEGRLDALFELLH